MKKKKSTLYKIKFIDFEKNPTIRLFNCLMFTVLFQSCKTGTL